MPAEPQANVEALIAAGEGPQLECKRQFPENAEQKRKILKTAAAFATCDGGTMVFGMDPDELTAIGLGDDDPKKLRDRFYDLVHRTVVPPPDAIIGPYTVDGKTILVMEVMPGRVTGRSGRSLHNVSRSSQLGVATARRLAAPPPVLADAVPPEVTDRRRPLKQPEPPGPPARPAADLSTAAVRRPARPRR